MPNKNYFAQLSPKQKAELFLIYTSNGMYNLDEIINHYNSEMDRAYSSTDKDMVARMHDVNAPYLLDEEGNKMTHRMASGDGYVFPTVQRNDNGELQSYENTEDWGAQIAIERNDTLQFKLPSLADYFSRNYKTHLDNPIMHADGGNLFQNDEEVDSTQDNSEEQNGSTMENLDDILRNNFDKAKKEYFDFINQKVESYSNEYFKEEKRLKKRYNEASKILAENTVNKYPNILNVANWSYDDDKSRKYVINHGIREHESEADEAQEFFRTYFFSKGFEDVLNNQKKYYNNRHPYRKYFAGPQTTELKQRMQAAAKRDNSRTTIVLDGYPEMSFYSPWYDVSFVYKPQDYEYRTREYDKEEHPYMGVLGHEIAHAYNWITNGQQDALDINTGFEINGHDERYGERHSDVESLKWLLYKSGIKDVREDANVTEEDVKKLRKAYPNHRVFRQMNDDSKIALMLKLVAANNNSNITLENMAAYGGGLDSPFKKPLPEVRYADGGLISNDGDGNNGIINGLGTNVRKLYGKAKQILGIQNIPTESSVRGWTDDDIRNLARAFEGNSNKAYIGIKGDILGGYGHKLNTDEINKYWDSKNKKPTQNIDDDIIEEWLDSDIKKASDIVEKYYSNNLPSNIRAMLISLVYQGGELLIRGKRDETGAIREDWKGGSPKFEAALKAYLENKTQDGLQSVLEQMQYKDDGDNSISGMSSRYGLYRAMLENIADPENVYDYKYDGTFKLYKSNKVKK